MDQASSTNGNIGFAPLGAGDLIDRSVRFYRRFFWTFILIASPPMIAGMVITVAWTSFARWLFLGGGSVTPDTYFAYYMFVWFGSLAIWFTQTAATLVVMGGAARNFVRHLLYGEPITFRETYANVRRRLGGLTGASILISIIVGVIGVVIFYFTLIAAMFGLGIAALVFRAIPLLVAVVGTAVVLVILSLGALLFFLIASRFAYVQQAMMVEGLGVFAAISRSASLASGNVKRFAALFIFTTVAAYSALALLYVPLGWYAWVEGVSLVGDADIAPQWYEIASQFIGQLSFILLSPVWMVGLCLLYVDERIRREGYDIELLAARRLGAIPAVPDVYRNPLQPAIGEAQKQYERPSSMLGLE